MLSSPSQSTRLNQFIRQTVGQICFHFPGPHPRTPHILNRLLEGEKDTAHSGWWPSKAQSSPTKSFLILFHLNLNSLITLNSIRIFSLGAIKIRSLEALPSAILTHQLMQPHPHPLHPHGQVHLPETFLPCAVPSQGGGFPYSSRGNAAPASPC